MREVLGGYISKIESFTTVVYLTTVLGEPSPIEYLFKHGIQYFIEIHARIGKTRLHNDLQAPSVNVAHRYPKASYDILPLEYLEHSGYQVCAFTTDSVRPERYTPN